MEGNKRMLINGLNAKKDMNLEFAQKKLISFTHKRVWKYSENKFNAILFKKKTLYFFFVL